jgi:F0F1-type ATP synthase assembly protein I
VAGNGPGLGDLLSMGVTLALCVAAGYGLGWLVDQAFGTFPGFALVGILLGFALASLYVYKLFKRYS